MWISLDRPWKVISQKHCLMALSVLTASNIITSEIKKERSSFVKKILAVKSTWSRAPCPTQWSDGYHPYLPLLPSYFYTSILLVLL